MKAIAEYIVKIKVVEDYDGETTEKIKVLDTEGINKVKSGAEERLKDIILDEMSENTDVSVNTIRFEFLKGM